MLDIKLLRDSNELVEEQLRAKGFKLDLKLYAKLENKRKELQVSTQDMQMLKNKKSKLIGVAKSKGDDVQALLDEVADIGEQLKEKEKDLSALQLELNDFLMSIPNIPHASVPLGATEDENVEVRKWGEIPTFDFSVKHHDELAGQNMDFSRSAKLSGSRFVVLKDNIARLHRALAQFMLDYHTQQHNYQEIMVPYLVRSAILEGTGQFPKFKEDQFGVQEEDLWLIPTSEVPVTNLIREEVLSESVLPLKFACHSACFRREAGSYGKDLRGMFRQHQFEKIELIHISKPEDSYAALESLTQHAEKILQELHLPYRVTSLCAGDLGFTASKTYDLEVWLPSQNAYKEISSCSNTESFQARRMQARFKRNDTKKNELLHTLNGSGVAVGRALIAVIENYQTKDGKIKIPYVLQKYMSGAKFI